MLRVVFFGMDLRVLEALRFCSVHLIGAYLPPAPYWIRKRLSPLLRLHQRFFQKRFRTVAVYGHLADFLAEHNITALQSSDVNNPEFLQTLAKLMPDLGIVTNFGQIIVDRLLNIPKYGFINFHPTLLPRYRGPTPLGNILLNGDKISGATWYQMTGKIDQGDILAQEAFSIEPDDTIRELEEKSMALAIKMLGPLIKDIEEGKLRARAQNEADATYYPKLTKEEKERLIAMRKFF